MMALMPLAMAATGTEYFHRGVSLHDFDLCLVPAVRSSCQPRYLAYMHPKK